MSVPALVKADPRTIQDKFLVGYQGWFTCRGDGAPVHAGHHGWLHWFDRPIVDGGRPNMDLWPDVSAYSPSELFPAPGLTLPGGEPACLFSSRHPHTVQRHFRWMAEHGIDGCFLQRFASQIEVNGHEQGAKADIMRLRDEIGDRVREAAEKEGRVFAIMYDIYGVSTDQLQRSVVVDWNHLVRQCALLDSPNYLREKGRPVVGIWGVGFAKNRHDPYVLRQIVHRLRSMTPGGAYVMAGTPTHWNTLDGDADPNPAFLDIYYNDFDAISPWNVGLYRDLAGADKFAEHRMRCDIKALQQHCRGQNVDYIPVVWPGVSEYHISNKQIEPNFVPRDGGRFLWRQIYNARSNGAKIIYGAMWDEYDGGTALMPVTSHTYKLPQDERFIALDVDGYDLPPDWYMRICGLAAESLRGERHVSDTFPKMELDDYWTSRPRFASKLTDISGNDNVSGSHPRFSSDPGSTSGPAISSLRDLSSDPNVAPGVVSISSSAVTSAKTAPDSLGVDQELGNGDAPPPYSLEGPTNQVPQEFVSTGSLSPMPSINLLSRASMSSPSAIDEASATHQRLDFTDAASSTSSTDSLSLLHNLDGRSHLQQSASSVVSSSLTQLAFNSEDGYLMNDTGKQPPLPVRQPQSTFVGGFVQGPPRTLRSPRSITEASSIVADGSHRNHATNDDSNPHDAHLALTLTAQPQAAHTHKILEPLTHTSISRSCSSVYPNAQLSPAEWQIQNSLCYKSGSCLSSSRPSHPHHRNPALLVPPPRHPSVVPHHDASSALAYKVCARTTDSQSSCLNHQQSLHHQPSHHDASLRQAHLVYSQPQHPQPLHTPVPQPMLTNPAWGIVDRITGKERRKNLEQGVDSKNSEL